MARKLRVEYPGAIYHVVNRGNFRSWIFETEGAQEAFELCLGQACRRSGWLLHAYVLMGNHYHLALETPGPNLAAGMQWLEATFANRFNRFRAEHGHLFQGRYKAIVLESGKEGLGRVCDYIALNPCRAGLCDVAGLSHYRRSLYWRLCNPGSREDYMRPLTALSLAGGMPDTEQGRAAYAQYLQARLDSWRQLPDKQVASLSTGWAIGSEAFRAGIAQAHKPASQTRTVGSGSMKEVQQLQWQAALDDCLNRLKAEEKAEPGASAIWKIAVALVMKRHTCASNSWLAERLQMNSGKYVSRLVCDQSYQRRVPEELIERLRVKWAT